jgi:multidrug efflux system outer membrane protein
MKQIKCITAALCLPLGAFLCLSGCATMAPLFTRPLAPVPADRPNGPAYQKGAGQTSAEAVADIPWQKFFVDQRLQRVISLALENNHDLRITALNIERSQAQYRVQRAELFPKLDATASGSGQGVSETLSSTGEATTDEQYNVGLGASAYELNLFGRIKSLKSQALAQYLASQEAQRTVRISLIAEVATDSLTLAADREQLKLSQDTLKAQQASYQLINKRRNKRRFELDLRQVQTRVDAARVDIARYTTLVAKDENALNLVVGSKVPAELQLPALADAQETVKDVAPGLPSTVLLRRPDILQAEQLLKGYNANIGAARAAFFPRITLVGSIGSGSDELSGLFDSGSLAWSFVPQITLPIFDAGTNKANLKVAEVDKKIAVARYEKTIQTAFREVADALSQRGTIGEQMTAQKSLTDATATSYRLSQARYEKGVDSYLTVLDSQRSLYAAQQELIATRLTRLTNLVTLYKVLGGGGGDAMPLAQTH